MSRYFKYDVNYVMNITDIDDKIINKSKEENKEFFEFAKYWEKDFHEICELLQIDSPDRLTRVTEYIPEIITYIEQLINNRCAYEMNGSVYFDLQAYQSKGYTYPLLKQPTINEESEVSENKDKKDNRDFSLWKNAKEGEPCWESPWGKGRPGWHIECSVMCSSVLPTPIDIHSGGEDLVFPHHDNEIAQSQAHSGCDQWINYFLHTGHMNIKGLKMSKSLKNFITIRKMLETVNP